MSEKYQALVRLHEGESARLIADDMGVSYSTVLNWNRSLQEAKETGTVQQLLAMNDQALTDMVNDAAMRLPNEIEDSVLRALPAKVNGLKALETDLQDVAKILVQRVRGQGATAETAADVHQLAETLCLIQKSFFAVGTTVQIQQNNGNGQGYSEFLGDSPGVILNVENN